MKLQPVLLLALTVLALAAGDARAACFPVRSEVVSLGEKAARFYADRSLTKSIDEQKASMETSGMGVGRIARSELSCKPFPNLIGADEWRCAGEAKLCTTVVSSEKPIPAKMGSRRRKPATQKR
jgi:hypothetical protein